MGEFPKALSCVRGAFKFYGKVCFRESELSIRTDLSVPNCGVAVVATTEKTLPIAAVHLRESALSIRTDLSVSNCAVVATTKNRQQPDDKLLPV